MTTVQDLLKEALKILADHDRLIQQLKEVTDKHNLAIDLIAENSVISHKIANNQAEQITFLKEELAKFNSRIPCEDRRLK